MRILNAVELVFLKFSVLIFNHMKNTKEGSIVPILIVITILIIGVWVYFLMKSGNNSQLPEETKVTTTQVSKTATSPGKNMYTFQKIDEIGASLAGFLNVYNAVLTVNGFKQVSVGPNVGGPSPISYKSSQDRVYVMYSVYYPNCPAGYVADYFSNLGTQVPTAKQSRSTALANFKKDLSCLGDVKLNPVEFGME